jgi:hypothetical protein
MTFLAPSSFDRTGDDDLAGCFEVGHPHVAVGPPAGHVAVLVVEPEHCRHGPGVVLGGLLHGVAPGHDRAHALVEREGAGGGEGGVLAQAVAGGGAGGDADALDGVEHHQAEDERRQLGVARLAQLLGVGLEQQAGDVTAGNDRRFADQLP